MIPVHAEGESIQTSWLNQRTVAKVLFVVPHILIIDQMARLSDRWDVIAEKANWDLAFVARIFIKSVPRLNLIGSGERLSKVSVKLIEADFFVSWHSKLKIQL